MEMPAHDQETGLEEIRFLRFCRVEIFFSVSIERSGAIASLSERLAQRSD